jgi:hypothetical protein
MTYAGPPNHAEIHRNKGRKDQNKSNIVLQDQHYLNPPRIKTEELSDEKISIEVYSKLK